MSNNPFPLSKEKLLSALLGEHLSAQIAEQIELFDPATATAERPRAGADRWMRELEEDRGPGAAVVRSDKPNGVK